MSENIIFVILTSKLINLQIRDLQSQLTQERGSTAGSVQELKESRSRIEALISKVSDLEGANLALNQKIADMAQEMEDQRSSHRAQLAAKDDEIKRLLDELTNQVRRINDVVYLVEIGYVRHILSQFVNIKISSYECLFCNYKVFCV